VPEPDGYNAGWLLYWLQKYNFWWFVHFFERKKVVEIIRLTQVDFYNGYKTVRKVIKTGTGTLAIKGLVTDDATGSTLKGAKLTFTLNGSATLTKSANSKNSFTRKSADKGGFFVRPVADGTYQVTAELPGYKKATVAVSVISGQMSILDIGLERA
jgi:hypothetical protein